MMRQTNPRAAGTGAGRPGFFAARPALPFLAPAVIYLALLTLFPFIYSVVLSLSRRNLARPYLNKFVGLGNYGTLFTDSLFRTAIAQTFIVTAASIAIELVVGYFVARLFFSLAGNRFAGALRTIYILPMMLTPLVSGLLWSYILDPTLGIADYLLQVVGLPPYAWFSSAKTALFTIILVNAWQWGPFLMLLILAGLLAIPGELYEAAQLDGARWFHLMRFIELPSLRNVVMIGVILRVIDNFRLFDVVYAATRGGPGTSTEVVTMYAFREMFQFFNVGYASAAAVIILAIGLALANVAVRFLRAEESNVR